MNLIEKLGIEKCRGIVDGAKPYDTGINILSMRYFGGDKFCRGDVLICEIKQAIEKYDSEHAEMIDYSQAVKVVEK